MAIRLAFIGVLVLALCDYSQSKGEFDPKMLERISRQHLPVQFCKSLCNKDICELFQQLKGVSSRCNEETAKFARRISALKKKSGNKEAKRRIASDFRRFKKSFRNDMRKIRQKRLLLPRTDLENANVLQLIQKIVQHLVVIPQKISLMLFGGHGIPEHIPTETTTSIPSSSDSEASASSASSEDDYSDG